MDKSAGGPTVAIVDPHTEPAHALTVAVPPTAPRAYASPESVSSLVMLTAAVSEELQVTEASCCVLLSLNVPVAIICCAVSSGTVGLFGFTAMETRFGGVDVPGSYSSALVR